MRTQTLLVVVVVLALLMTLCSGCIFGGKKSDKGTPPGASAGAPGGAAAGGAGGPSGPAGKDAMGGPPPGGPGAPVAPAAPGGPGGSGGPPGAPPGGPGGPVEAGPSGLGAPGGPAAAGPEGASAPTGSVVVAPPGATSRQGLDAKHKGGTDGYDMALAIFEANLVNNAKDTLALYGKAWIQAERGQRPDAATTFKSFLALSKDSAKNKEARAAVSRMKSTPAAAPPMREMAPMGPSGPPAGGPGGPPPGGPGGPPR